MSPGSRTATVTPPTAGPRRSVDSGGRSIHRLSLRGNRQLNHAMHIVRGDPDPASHSPGRGFYDRKLAEGKTTERSAPRIETTDHRRRLPRNYAPTPHRRAREGKRGRLMNPAWPTSTPRKPALRKNHSRTTTNATTPTATRATDTASTQPERALTTKRRSIGFASCSPIAPGRGFRRCALLR